MVVEYRALITRMKLVPHLSLVPSYTDIENNNDEE